MAINVIILAVVVVLALVFHRFILYPAFLSPLSKIPNAHPTSPVSPAWILWTKWRGHRNRAIHEAHQRLGDVVRLGPSELSVNCVDGGLRAIYAGNFEKDDWYSNLFANYGVLNMFSIQQNKPHGARKRMLSHIYSKSFLHSSQALTNIAKHLIYDRLLPKLQAPASNSEAVDAYQVFNAATMDFITAYLFGLASSTNHLQDQEKNQRWLKLYWSRGAYNFWPQQLPDLTRWLSKVGIRVVPKWVDAANREIDDWTLKMCDAAEKAVAINDETITRREGVLPVVYSKLKSALEQENEKTRAVTAGNPPSDIRLEVASEMLDHLAAGFETSGITLTYIAWELSRHPSIQRQLRSELLSLSEPLLISNPSTLPSSQELDALPLLQAVLMETLRLHPALPGSQPRTTPSSSSAPTINGYTNIPPNIRVSAQAYSLHRHPSAFPHPDQWLPARWLGSGLPEETEKKERWFWAFGSGGRMCVGSNFAIFNMKMVLAAIYTNFETVVVDDEGIEQVDSYTAPPRGHRLVLRFEPVGR